MSRLSSLPAAKSDNLGRGVAPVHHAKLSSKKWWLVLVLVWGISAFYLVPFIDRGWIPHDEGTLAHSAERVLMGELPHRDFGDVYTGGLSYLHALAFQAFGTSLLSLRILLFIFALIWVPALYYSASRLVSPVVAGGAVLLALVWSLPNYFAALPSWYNLFFATFGIAALLRYLETSRRRWLIVAGACGGASFLIKIVGFYYIVAVLLFLCFREQCISHAGRTGGSERGRAYSLFVGAALLLFVLLLAVLIYSRLGVVEIVHFVLPGATLAALVLWNEWREPAGGARERLVTLSRLIIPFAFGAAVPIALFLVPYVLSGSLSDFFHGVFVLPRRRMNFAAARPPSLSLSILATLPLVLFLGLPYWRDRIRRLDAAIILLVLGTALVAVPKFPPIFSVVVYSVRTLVPVTVLAGALLLLRVRGVTQLSILRRQQLMLLLCIMAMCSLVQFPFSVPIYFCYVAPLVVLAALAIFSWRERKWRFAPAVVFGFYLLFGVLWVNRSYIVSRPSHDALHFREAPMEVLELERGGIRVSRSDKQEYEQLVAILRAHSSGEFIYAAPDSPEVYFLTGLRNPTRTLFEFFDDPVNRADQILRLLEERRVSVIAIKQSPGYSGPVTRELRTELQARFPYSAEVGRFVVRWR